MPLCLEDPRRCSYAWKTPRRCGRGADSILRVSWMFIRRLGATQSNGAGKGRTNGRTYQKKDSPIPPLEKQGESLVMSVIEGQIEGKRKPDRMPAAWIDDIVRCTEGGLPAAHAGTRQDGNSHNTGECVYLGVVHFSQVRNKG